MDFAIQEDFRKKKQLSMELDMYLVNIASKEAIYCYRINFLNVKLASLRNIPIVFIIKFTQIKVFN
jgi:hypothetical protein